MGFSGNRLRGFRKRSKLTLQEVADACRVHFTSVWQWEKSRTKPHVDYLPTLSRLFRVKIGAFFDREEEKPVQGP